MKKLLLIGAFLSSHVYADTNDMAGVRQLAVRSKPATESLFLSPTTQVTCQTYSELQNDGKALEAFNVEFKLSGPGLIQIGETVWASVVDGFFASFKDGDKNYPQVGVMRYSKSLKAFIIEVSVNTSNQSLEGNVFKNRLAYKSRYFSDRHVLFYYVCKESIDKSQNHPPSSTTQFRKSDQDKMKQVMEYEI